MEIACVIDSGWASPTRPGRSGGPRSGRDALPDPLAAAERGEAIARRLEGVGAAVEPGRPGEAFFAVDGLRGIHGGDSAGVLGAARQALGPEPRLGLAPTRLAAFAAAREARRRRGAAGVAGVAEVVSAAALDGFLAKLPVSILPLRLDLEESGAAADLVLALERLGVRTLGALGAVDAGPVADRFGPLGLRAWRLARGEEEPLRPRQPVADLTARLELPEGIAGEQLDRALGLLIDRLLASPRRRGRTLIGLRLGALLSAGGSWSVEQGLGRPSASARVLRSVLAPRLRALPGPATALRLRALGLGPAATDQLELAVGGSEPRRRRLGEAVREVRAAQGAEALLRILPVDSGSRVPERRELLTPFPEP